MRLRRASGSLRRSAVRPVRASRRRAAFTLLELLLVMGLLGIVFAVASLGLERFDPGARGLQTTVATFFESARDRARATGFPVVVELLPATGEDPAQIARTIYRPVREANFEARFLAAQGVAPLDPARTGSVGRCGACLDLSEGGGSYVEGRGGTFRAPHGLAVDLSLYAEDGEGGTVLDWEGLLSLRLQRDGALVLEVETESAEGGGGARLQTEPGVVLPGRWYRLRLTAGDGRLGLERDGEAMASEEFAGRIPEPEKPPYLGDPKGTFRGKIDEFVAYARVREAGPTVREGAGLRLSEPRVVFDRNGRLDTAAHEHEVEVEIVELDERVGGFLVGRFAQEAAPL